MASLINTIAGRITLGVVLLHLLLLPTMLFGLAYLFKQSNEELFLNSTRGYAIGFVDNLERMGTDATDQEIVELLDSVVLSGGGVLAEIVGGSTVLRSSLNDADAAARFREDLGVGQSGDHVYYLSLPVDIRGEARTLHVGFDEALYHEQNSIALKNGTIAVALYMVILLLMLPLIGNRIVQPIKKIQEAARAIASGRLAEPLVVSTEMREVVELSRDLERMKNQLIGINEQLKTQIAELEASENQRRSLEKQLHHSQRLETIGIMAGGFAHALNNMLVPIILYTEMTHEALPPGRPERKDLERVMNAARRAKHIVGQVLTFSRRVDEVAFEPIDVGQIAREAVELVRASIPASVSIRLHVPDDCPWVLGDAGQVSQLIFNMCNNALQSIETGSGHIDVSIDTVTADERPARLRTTLGDDDCLRLRISDNGHGMDDETMKHIFEPFFTTRSVGKGTGLGLSVVHGIVADLDGIIDVESTVGAGTTFTVYLPVIERSIPEMREHA